MNSHKLEPATTQAATTKRCARIACGVTNPRHDSRWCSEVCERIHTAMASIPHASGYIADMGRGAAVKHAEPFPWLDARVAP